MIDSIFSKTGFLVRASVLVFAILFYGFFKSNYGEYWVKSQSYDILIDSATINYPISSVRDLMERGFVPTPISQAYVDKNPELKYFKWSIFNFSSTGYHGNIYTNVPDYLPYQKGEVQIDLLVWNYTTSKMDYLDAPVFYYGIHTDTAPITIDGKRFEPFMSLNDVEGLFRGYEFFQHEILGDNFEYITRQNYPYLTSYTYGWEGVEDFSDHSDRYTYCAYSPQNSFGLVFNEQNQLIRVVVGKGLSGQLLAPLDHLQDVLYNAALVLSALAILHIFEFGYRVKIGEISM